jgi:hypothetical protein
VAWGGEDALPRDLVPGGPLALAVALFNFAATPEPENHGAFLAALLDAAGAGTPLVALADESGFRARFPADSLRLTKRREGWRALAAERGITLVFADLEQPELAIAEAALNEAIERHARGARAAA